MLTKEERATIAERLRSTGDLDDRIFYKAVVGKRMPGTTSYMEDLATMSRVILDLCDTSNMIELPHDKDGEVIHINDVVYDNTGMEWEVNEFRFPFDDNCIYARADDDYATFRPGELAHKKPVTIASLVSELRHVLDKGQMSAWSMAELCDIADDLEMLGDSDD